MISESCETTCWGCGLRLSLPSHASVFKCGWCGAITNPNKQKCVKECFRWRLLRDRCIVSIVLVFMLFLICKPLLFLLVLYFICCHPVWLDVAPGSQFFSPPSSFSTLPPNLWYQMSVQFLRFDWEIQIETWIFKKFIKLDVIVIFKGGFSGTLIIFLR